MDFDQSSVGVGALDHRSALTTTLRNVVLAAGILFIGLAPTVASGQPMHDKARGGGFFIGFWEGIDVVDGSTVQYSISDTDRDGIFDIVYRESSFYTCVSSDNTQGRGIIVGTGKVSEPGTLEVEDAQRTCINDDGSPGPIKDVAFRLIASPRDDVLITPFPDGTEIIAHRTSR
jgi:hypothetical protein